MSKTMLEEANFLILDEPTNHLDLESITALNNGLIDYPGTVVFTSHDHTYTYNCEQNYRNYSKWNVG